MFKYNFKNIRLVSKNYITQRPLWDLALLVFVSEMGDKQLQIMTKVEKQTKTKWFYSCWFL